MTRTPTTTRTRSSRTATPLATIAAARQGRTSSNRIACSMGASISLRRRQVLPRQPQTLVQRMLGAPAELVRRACRIDDAAVDVAGPRGRIGRWPLIAADASTRRVQVVDGRLHSRADVEDAAL